LCVSVHRLRLRAGRPRSLDLSSASIDSKMSAATTSTSSEEQHPSLPRQHSNTASTLEEEKPEDTEGKDTPTPLTTSEGKEPSKKASDKSGSSKVLSKRHSFKANHSLERSAKSSPAEKKKVSVHRRTSSDVTSHRLSLSSSVGNISSLYSEPMDGSSDFSKEGGKAGSCRSSPDTTAKDCPEAKGAGETKKKAVGGAALSRSPTKGNANKSPPEEGKEKVEDLPRTVLVLTGGQGYKCLREDTPNNGPPHNNTDAHILVWEMKL